MKRLEAIVHQLVHAERERFLAQVRVPPKPSLRNGRDDSLLACPVTPFQLLGVRHPSPHRSAFVSRVTRRETKRRVQATAEQRALVVLDIPLLYETKAERTVCA